MLADPFIQTSLGLLPCLEGTQTLAHFRGALQDDPGSIPDGIKPPPFYRHIRLATSMMV